MDDNIDLETVPVKVSTVNFDGLERTKSDFVADAVTDVFRSKTFGELILRVGQAQQNLRRLEIFRDVGTVIDIDKENELIDSLDQYTVTFLVKELSRVTASAKTEMGARADAQVKTGLRMPNLFGRGERLECEYAYSSNKEKNMEMSMAKPILGLPNASVKGSVLQSNSTASQTSYHNTMMGLLMAFYCHKIDPRFRDIHLKLEYEGMWRHIKPMHWATPFAVRSDCGHSFKSAVRHTLTIDNRDHAVLPSNGVYVNFLQEVAGLLGDARFHKFDVDVQHNLPLLSHMVLQSSFRMGVITPFGCNPKNCGIADRFFFGGPSSLRGFEQRGINIGAGGVATGNLGYWAYAVHLYAPLPYVNRRFPMVDNCRLHLFCNAGNLADRILGDNILKDLRAACGVGLAVGLGNFGRLENVRPECLMTEPGINSILFGEDTTGEDLLTKLKDTVTHHHKNASDEVTIYTESNFWGIPWTMKVTNCSNVPALLYKKASSINSHDNCVILYSHEACHGRHVTIAPGTDGHSHLGEVNFDDTTASIGPCNETVSDDGSSENKEADKKRTRRNLNLNSLLGENSKSSSNSESDENDDEENNDHANFSNVLKKIMKTLSVNGLVSGLSQFSDDNQNHSD